MSTTPDDAFRTIAKNSEAVFKDRSSKFIAYTFQVDSEEAAKQLLKQLKKEHFSAAHLCWALVLGRSSDFQKSSDDREPANSAGKPILRSILSAGLTNVYVVVVRYFGGKLLGVPGLIHAYGGAAGLAIEASGTREVISSDRYFLEAGPSALDELFRIFRYEGIKCFPASEKGLQGIIFEVRQSRTSELIKKLEEKNFRNPIKMP
jgi:uncharacterized YigZ family protein